MYGDGFSSETDVIAVKEKIEAIPDAMRQMGWNVSADLMERWLHSPRWVLPQAWKSGEPPDPASLSPAHMDQRIVRMSWAMTNPSVRIAMGALRTNMANGAARELLRKRMKALPWGTSTRTGFGSRQDSAVMLERTCQSNYENFGSKLDTLDDLYGALGMATLKVALIGEAIRDERTGRLALRVTHAGFYIRDTYDFAGAQYLGTWTKSGVLSKSQVLMNAVMDGLAFRWGKPVGHVSNRDFDSYRSSTGFGGDFMIYSDVHWEPLALTLDLG